MTQAAVRQSGRCRAAARRRVHRCAPGAISSRTSDQIGLTLEEFCSRMTGGWLFGYVVALRRQEIETVIVCVSRRVTSTLRTAHEPTAERVSWSYGHREPYPRRPGAG